MNLQLLSVIYIEYAPGNQQYRLYTQVHNDTQEVLYDCQVFVYVNPEKEKKFL